MNSHVRLEPDACPACGRLLDAATAVDGSGVSPSPGDLTVCLCGTPLQFGEDLKVGRVDWSTLDPESAAELRRVVGVIMMTPMVPRVQP